VALGPNELQPEKMITPLNKQLQQPINNNGERQTNSEINSVELPEYGGRSYLVRVTLVRKVTHALMRIITRL